MEGLPKKQRTSEVGGTARVVVVLGMHRSGTSALARVLERCGATPPRTIMKPGPDNPEGFCESPVLVDLADRVLLEHGMGWASLGSVPESWFRTGAGERFVRRYARALEEEFPDPGTALLKDPRLCRMVPLIAGALDTMAVEPRYVLALRHPSEVARSLQERNGIGLERGLLLWLRHCLDAERNTRGRPRAIVTYAELVEDWRGVAEALAAALDLPGLDASPASPSPGISPIHRHHDAADETWPVAELVREWAETAYDVLRRLRTRSGADDPGALDALRDAVDRMERMWLPVTRELEAETRREREERAAVQRHLADAEVEVEQLRTQVEDRDRLRTNLAHAEAVIDDLARKVADRNEVETHLRSAEQTIEELRARVSEQEIRLGERGALRRIRHGLGRASSSAGNHASLWARRLFWALPLSVPRRLQVKRVVSRMKGWTSPTGPVPDPRLDGPGADRGSDAREHLRRTTEHALDTFLAGGHSVRLPRPRRPPGVTVILVLYDQAALTLACLESLGESSYRDFEVVIVDNASTDRTPELLERVAPCRVIRNDENLHFLRGCNQAVEHATGRHLLFLNNDTRIAPDAIEQALSVFEEEEGVGAVGARLVLPNGSLQEAGSIVWSDGSCLGYGRGEDPADPRFAFRRDVDYCSTAFLLTPRALFEGLGGFDERFAPAYYEETDYCVRLWEEGFRVIYEPRVVVRHFEFASATWEGAAQLCARNQGRFLEKHRARLTDHMPPAREHVVRARSARRDAPRILCVDDRVPHLELGSGFPRANRLIREMTDAGCEVTLYATDQSPEPWDAVYRDIPPDVECLRGNRHGDLEEILRERKGAIDTLFVSRPHNMDAVNRLLRRGGAFAEGVRIVYDAEAIFGLREASRRMVSGRPVQTDRLNAMVRAEVSIAARADVVLAVSEAEADHFRSLPGVRVEVLGHSLDPDPTPRAFEDRAGFLFVGAFHNDDSPNTDSVVWFVHDVWPTLRNLLEPDTPTLSVVGKNPSRRVVALGNHPGVRVEGEVPDTRPHYDGTRVFVVPTRYAAGIPFKAHEAATKGVPMVATDLIAGQLGWTDGHELLVADRSDPDSFAHHCARLHSDPKLWERVRLAALERVREECSPEAQRATLLRALGLSDRDRAIDRAAAGAGPGLLLSTHVHQPEGDS